MRVAVRRVHGHDHAHVMGGRKGYELDQTILQRCDALLDGFEAVFLYLFAAYFADAKLAVFYFF